MTALMIYLILAELFVIAFTFVPLTQRAMIRSKTPLLGYCIASALTVVFWFAIFIPLVFYRATRD